MNQIFRPTHETAPLFLYKHVILATYSWYCQGYMIGYMGFIYVWHDFVIFLLIWKIKADQPHLCNYLHTPTIKVVGQTVQRWEVGRADRRTDRQTDGHYQLHYLPRFAVDNDTIPALPGFLYKRVLEWLHNCWNWIIIVWFYFRWACGVIMYTL